MRHWLSVPSAALLFCAVIGSAGNAHAQEQAAAEALFRSAREAAERGDWITACDRFEESNRLESAPGTAFNLAKCREELGQIASAWKHYGEVVQRLPETDPRVPYAREREAALAPLVPRLTLVAPRSDVKFRVRVNQMEVTEAMFGVSLPFNPGELVLWIQAEGHVDSKRSLRLSVGDRKTVQLRLGPIVTEESGETKPSESVVRQGDSGPGSGRKTAAWISMGVGAAGVAAGAAGFFWALSEQNTVNQHCQGTRCDLEGFEASQRGPTAVILGAVGLGVGALGLGIGSYLFATGSGESVNVSVRPLFEGASLSIEGRL